MFTVARKIRSKYYTRFMRESSVKSQLIQMMLVLCVILCLHIYAMIYFEGLTLGDSIWLTFTSATTVGYGDLSAKTFEGRIATIILLYIGGIAIFAQVFTKYFDHYQDVKKRMLKGDWSWQMENHIVFLNSSKDINEEYFYRSILGLRQSHTEVSQAPIIIVCEYFTKALPERLRELNVVHVSKPLANKETLESASIHKAHTVVIFSCDGLDSVSDSLNFELIHRLRDSGVKARIIVEVVNDEKRPIFKKIGANNVLRPIRCYPEHIMRAIIAPGTEQIIESLFDSGGEECIRYPLEIEAKWLDIVQRFIQSDFGVPVGYEEVTGKIVNCPSSREFIKARAIFTIVHQENIKTPMQIKNLMRGI